MNTEPLKITVAGLDLGSANLKIAAVDKGTVDIITN
jgi:molecular chaperone DnaK (HSP70)